MHYLQNVNITNVMDWWAVKREKNAPPSRFHFSYSSISLLLLRLPVPLLAVCESHGGCAEVDSLTEAVVGKGFLLGCISCKNREEVRARATVDWHFKPPEEEEFRHVSHIQVHSNLESNYVPASPVRQFFLIENFLDYPTRKIHIWEKYDLTAWWSLNLTPNLNCNT